MLAGVARGEHFHRHQPGFDQRLEAAADHLDFLVDRQLPEADRLRRRHQDAQRPLALDDRIGGDVGQHVADEVNLLGRQEALPAGVVGELPRLLADPRDHRRQHQIELAAALPRARLVVEPAHVALEQRLEEMAAEFHHLARRSAASLARGWCSP